MNYSEEQWVKCKWDIRKVPLGEVCYKYFPELYERFKPIIENYVEEDYQISADKLIRYIVLSYHRFSPFQINEQNIIKRKIEVCEFLGINVNDKSIEKIIANRNQLANNASIYFLKQDDSMDYLELQQYLLAYYQIMSALTDDSNQDTSKTTQDIAKVKLSIVKEMKGIKSEIEQLSAKVFRDDSDLLNYVERYKKAEEESFCILSPEQYVASKRPKE